MNVSKAFPYSRRVEFRFDLMKKQHTSLTRISDVRLGLNNFIWRFHWIRHWCKLRQLPNVLRGVHASLSKMMVDFDSKNSSF